MLCDVHVRRGLGSSLAVIHHETDRSVSFEELAVRSDRMAGAFDSLGVRPGDRVALRGQNCPEYLIAAIAAWKIGAAVTLIPALARAAEFEFFLNDTEPRLLVLTQTEGAEIRGAIAARADLTVISTADSGDGVLSGTRCWTPDAGGRRSARISTESRSSGTREEQPAGPRAAITPNADSSWAASRSVGPSMLTSGSAGPRPRRWGTPWDSSTAQTSRCSTASAS